MLIHFPALIIFGVDVITFSIDLGIFYSVFLVVSLTLNLEAGYAGVPNFGKALFVAGGAAVSGSVSGRISALILAVNTSGDYNSRVPQIIGQLNADLSSRPFLSLGILLFGVAIAAGVGAALGFLASYPAIRLREDYLGMLLLASAQFFQIFLGGYDPLIGGTQGIEVPDFFGWANVGPGWRDFAILGAVGLFALLAYFYFEKLARSPLGRTLRAIRDNELAARSLGKDDVAIRRKVIVVASAISGMAGAFLTFYVESVGPGTWTRQAWTFPIWVAVIIGGAASNSGVALGAFTYTFILKAVDQVKFAFQPVLPIDVNWVEYFAFASLVIAFLVLRPGGIQPERPSATLPRPEIVALITPGHDLQDSGLEQELRRKTGDAS